jgi:2-aminophenol/2-amino-5-chlorophenol 1,6-dioxygenase alpha subunit
MIERGLIVPGRPQPLLMPEKNPGWKKLREAHERLAQKIEKSGADLILIYSTQWLSVIGHQMQAHPNPKWTHVDQDWHDLGSIRYEFKMDADFAQAYVEASRARGLHARAVAYEGFPIDTGTVTALKLLNPKNKIPACVVSCNMYADRAETLVLGKAAADAAQKLGKKIIPVAVTALSNRVFYGDIAPAEDRIHSQKDDEWNRKILEILAEGRLEDVSQLAREFSAQANGDQKMKALWWLAAVMGQNNDYEGIVHEYQPVCGTGAALVELIPTTKAGFQKEFDEENAEVFVGDSRRHHLGETGAIVAKGAPKPVGAYPHARRVGDLLYLSGIGPRDPKTNEIPGGPVRDGAGHALKYDIEAQTRACIENVKHILQEAGSSLSQVLDVQVFLIDMDRDFVKFNKIYGEYFSGIGATRTTVAVSALPTPIAVELKVIAAAPASVQPGT